MSTGETSIKGVIFFSLNSYQNQDLRDIQDCSVRVREVLTRLRSTVLKNQ